MVIKLFDQIKYLDSKYSGANNVFWNREVEFLSKFPSNSIFIGNASFFRNNWISPYRVEYFDVEKRIFSLGWHNFSPHWNQRAISLDLDPNNLINDILMKQNVYWVSNTEIKNYFVDYLNDKRFKFDSPRLVDSIDFVGNEYSVWKF